jgi:hypothetical protein
MSIWLRRFRNITMTIDLIKMISRWKRNAFINCESMIKRWRKTITRHVFSLMTTRIICISMWLTSVLLLLKRKIAYWSFSTKETSSRVVLTRSKTIFLRFASEYVIFLSHKKSTQTILNAAFTLTSSRVWIALRALMIFLSKSLMIDNLTRLICANFFFFFQH